MKISHEAPVYMFDEIDAQTDYNYALVHLFEESEQYYDKFKVLVDRGREVILDNSIFEKGEAFESEQFATWVSKLRSEWYIIPDKLENAEITVSNVQNWNRDYRSDLPGKTIGVVQGKTFEEIVWCYKMIEPVVDKVAISFDYSMFNQWFPNETTKYHAWMKGRVRLINMLESRRIINTDKPHHLLGCGLPQEFMYYRDKKWIDSLDTSNPVVHGLMNIRYEAYGLDNKESIKLCDLIDVIPTPEQYHTVMFNVASFRRLCK